MQQLLNQSGEALVRGHYNHLGSSKLWQKHADMLDKMQTTLQAVEIREVKK